MAKENNAEVKVEGLTIGSVEIRTFMHKPLCSKCKEKGVNRFLTEHLGSVISTPQGEMPSSVWRCDHCKFEISLPPGAFPSFEHQEVRLAEVKGPRTGREDA